MTYLRGAVALITAGIFAYLAVTTVMFAGTGMYALYLQNEKTFGVTEEKELRAQERTFEVVCIKWKDANLIEKYTTYGDRKWCKDYVHRM